MSLSFSRPDSQPPKHHEHHHHQSVMRSPSTGRAIAGQSDLVSHHSTALRSLSVNQPHVQHFQFQRSSSSAAVGDSRSPSVHNIQQQSPVVQSHKKHNSQLQPTHVPSERTVPRRHRRPLDTQVQPRDDAHSDADHSQSPSISSRQIILSEQASNQPDNHPIRHHDPADINQSSNMYDSQTIETTNHQSQLNQRPSLAADHSSDINQHIRQSRDANLSAQPNGNSRRYEALNIDATEVNFLDSMSWGRKKRAKPDQAEPAAKKKYVPQVKFDILTREFVMNLLFPLPDQQMVTPSHGVIARMINQRFPHYEGKVNKEHVDNCVRFIRTHGDVHEAAKTGRERKYTEEHAKYVCELQMERAAATYDNLRQAAKHHFQTNLKFSDGTIHEMLITHVPKITTHRIYLEPWDRNDYATLVQRRKWCGEMLQIPHERLIFIDEAGFTLYLVPTRGRGVIGERINLAVPNHKGNQLNMIGAMTTSGLLHFECYYGTTDRRRYMEFVRNLKRQHAGLFREHDMVVIQDGASIHKGEDVDDAFQSGPVGVRPVRVMTMPHYSPQLNGIEELWSFVKHDVRAENALKAKAKLAAQRERKNQREKLRKEKMREEAAKTEAKRLKAIERHGAVTVRTRQMQRADVETEQQDGTYTNQSQSQHATNPSQSSDHQVEPSLWSDASEVEEEYRRDIDQNSQDVQLDENDNDYDFDEDDEVPKDTSTNQTIGQKRRTERGIGETDLLVTVMKCASHVTENHCQSWINHAVSTWVKCHGWQDGQPAPDLHRKDD